MKENYVKSDCSETWIENGIVVQDINPKLNEVTLPIAKQLIADRKAASGGKRVAVLVIVNNTVNINKETKQYYKEPEPYLNINAIAMVMDNFIATFVANLVFIFKENPVPTEFFNNREKALKWLEKYKEKE
jgi:hypothetical protein